MTAFNPKRKTALITGAQNGLGREFSKLHAEAGHDLILVDRHRWRLEALAGALRDIYGVSVRVIHTNLSSDQAGRDIVSELRRQGLQADVIITRGGYRLIGPFGDEALPGAVHRVCEEYRLPRPRVDIGAASKAYRFA